MYQDKDLSCKDCGTSFTFTAREQEFYAEKGFQNEPGRCKSCRDSRKNTGRQGGNDRRERQLFEAVCAECGTDTKVPFKPTNERPVYCRDCFTANR